MRITTYSLSIIFTILCISCNKQPDIVEFQLSKAYENISLNPDSSLVILNEIAPYVKENKEQYATWCLYKIWAQYRTYQNDISEKELSFAYNYYRSKDNNEKKALAYYLNSVVHSDKNVGDETEWARDLMMGCKYVENTNMHSLAAQLYICYSHVFLKRDQPEKSIPLLNKALWRTKKDGFKHRESMIYNNFSEVYEYIGRRTNEYSKCILYAQKAVKVAKENNLYAVYAKSLDFLSKAYFLNKKYDLALKYAIQSKDLNEKLYSKGIRKEKVRYITIANVHYLLNNIDSAVYYFKKGINYDNIYIKEDSYHGLYNIYKNDRVDYKKALFYGDNFFTLSDSINKKMQNDKIIKMEDEYAKKKAQAENRLLKVERKSILLISITIISILLICTLTTIMIFRNKLITKENKLKNIYLTIKKNKEQIRKNEQHINDLQSLISDDKEMSRQIEEKKGELYELQKKNDLLNEENFTLTKSINNLRKLSSAHRTDEMQSLLLRMEELEDKERKLTIELLNNDELLCKLREEPKFLKEIDWNHLYNVTDKVYNNLYERIKAENPQLTLLDLQLCILIKLRYTISQIAIMFGISATSVSKHKLRLKRKLLLNNPNIFDGGKSLDLIIWEY